MRSIRRSILVAALLAALAAVPVAAEEKEFDLGLRFNVLTGDGEPTNDVIGYGVTGHIPLQGRWRLGIGLDYSPEFDVERTAQIVGFEQAGSEEEEIDSKGESTALTAWIERTHGDRLEWVWGVGAGVADVEVDPLAGFRPNGQPFAVETDAGTELLAIANAGLRYWLGQRKWAISIDLGLEQHFSDWKLRETVSGEEVSVDDYLLTGVRIGFRRRF